MLRRLAIRRQLAATPRVSRRGTLNPGFASGAVALRPRLASSVSLADGAFDYDVIVIGGGHAGCEAAAASARMGARTALVTQRVDTIGELSCNPSMGGIGKGTLVREVDALDGLMARMTDRSGLQFRVLNRSRGPAVQAPRVQVDRDLYKAAMREEIDALQASADFRVVEASVHDVLLDPNDTIQGIVTKAGEHITAKSVIITAGTFLRGTIHVGKDSYPAGRLQRGKVREVEPPSTGLALTLERLKFPLGRLVTGTPPRIAKESIDYTNLFAQASDDPPVPMSLLNMATTFGPAADRRMAADASHKLPSTWQPNDELRGSPAAQGTITACHQTATEAVRHRRRPPPPPACHRRHCHCCRQRAFTDTPRAAGWSFAHACLGSGHVVDLCVVRLVGVINNNSVVCCRHCWLLFGHGRRRTHSFSSTTTSCRSTIVAPTVRLVCVPTTQQPPQSSSAALAVSVLRLALKPARD